MDLRNLIIHGYDSIDDETILVIISRHILELEKNVNEFLNKK